MGELEQIPVRTLRRELGHPPRKHYVCVDDRPYFSLPLTAPGTLSVGDYEPMWRAGRDFHIARIIATVGKHDDGTHPVDGCPTGGDLKVNVRRLTTDYSGDAAVLATDDILTISGSTHHDTATHENTDYNLVRVLEGEFLYLRVVQVGPTQPGRNLVVQIDLVPIRTGEFAV